MKLKLRLLPQKMPWVDCMGLCAVRECGEFAKTRAPPSKIPATSSTTTTISFVNSKRTLCLPFNSYPSTVQWLIVHGHVDAGRSRDASPFASAQLNLSKATVNKREFGVES